MILYLDTSALVKKYVDREAFRGGDRGVEVGLGHRHFGRCLRRALGCDLPQGLRAAC